MSETQKQVEQIDWSLFSDSEYYKDCTEFKISPSWDCIKSLDELVNDSKFIFSHDGFKGRRPRIVLNAPIDGYDCIEIDYDRHGLTTNGVTKFNETWGDSITDSSKDCIVFIKDFLIREGAKTHIIKK